MAGAGSTDTEDAGILHGQEHAAATIGYYRELAGGEGFGGDERAISALSSMRFFLRAD
ncbi:MAG: hypothetical protein ABI378_12820 [Chitinophagaceae bacterium]